MRVMSPEKCATILDQHEVAVQQSTAKLQIIIEFFNELADGGEHEFKNLSSLAVGIVTLCQEISDKLWECEISDICDSLKMLSPDQNKVIKHVAYLESIGIRGQSTAIELEV